MLFFILITFIVCVILYFISSSTAFSFAAKPQAPKPQPPKPQTRPPKPSTKKPNPRDNNIVVNLAPGTKCTNKSQCPSGYDCVQGICTFAAALRPQTKPPTNPPRPTKCKTNSDCPSGKVCMAGTCRYGISDIDNPTQKPPGAKCIRDSDCPTGRICKGGQCRYGTNGIPGDAQQAGVKGVANLNGKQTNVVNLGNGNVVYLDKTTGKLTVGSVSGGNLAPLPSKKRFFGLDDVLVLGIAGTIGVAMYLASKLENPSPGLQKQIINQAVAPFKGAGIMKPEDIKTLKLQPGKVYYSNQRQYIVDKNGKVQSIACKTKCKDTVNVSQASALQTVSIDAMKPGTVYQSGKNYYQVTQDGKGFEQCVPKSNRSLETEYRGIGSAISRLCSGRPQPANSLVQQAIQNAPQLGGITSQEQIAANEYILGHQDASYDQFQTWVMATGGQMISEAQFNQLRAQNNLPPTYHEVVPSSNEHPSLAQTATQNYIRQNPNASYDTYKKKFGASAMSLEEYNKLRQQVGIPPSYQSNLGQSPMTVTQLRVTNNPIYNFISNLYRNQPNAQLDVNVQNALENIQIWFSQNSAPLQQNGLNIHGYIGRFLEGNNTDLRTILLNNYHSNSNRNPNNITIASMLTNYISAANPQGSNYWMSVNPNVIRNVIKAFYDTRYPVGEHASMDNVIMRQYL